LIYIKYLLRQISTILTAVRLVEYLLTKISSNFKWKSSALWI